MVEAVVRRGCGLVLLVAVALKVEGGWSGQPLSLLSPRVQFIGMQVEALVGLWLVSGYASRGAWLAGVATYTLLAGVSGYLAWAGQTSCGCFGRVAVSPWSALALDVVCLAGLLVVAPERGWSLRTKPSAEGKVAAGTLLAVLGLTVFVWTDTGRLALARLRGDSLLVVQGEIELGTAARGQSLSVPVQVANIGSKPVRLVGGTASCACVATGDLPVDVPGGESVIVHLSIKFTGEPGRFRHTFQWYTDSPTQPHLTGSVAGQVAQAGRE